MTIALTEAVKSTGRLFLGVESSATGRAWRDRLDERGSARALAIAQRHDLPELLARILAGRGVEVEDAMSFLDPTVRALMPDPNRLAGMSAAANRLADAVAGGETIAIFGDYDVDGATAAATLARFLRHGGLAPLIHIPDRIFEGYGPNIEAIRALAARGASLLVTVDCGTTSHEPLAEAHRLGLEVIVIDHHLADEALPPALAVVNPNRLDDLSKLGHLAAVGLVFMTVVAVNRELRARDFWTAQRPEPDLLNLLDLVALGTVAARLKEKFGRPAFAIALEPGGIGTGSGRSIAGVDLGRVVRQAVHEELLIKGGGHAMAAGVTLRKDALAQFRAFLETMLGE